MFMPWSYRVSSVNFIVRYDWSHGITPRHYDTLPCRVLDLTHDQGDSGLTLVTRDVRPLMQHGMKCSELTMILK